MTKDELERQAAALVEANPAHICALCIPLGEEPLFDLGGKTRVVSASTIKTPILCTALEQVREAVDLARQAGVKNLSLDLMFGLPGQTLADWAETLEAALDLAPEHLSCYGLIPEEGTPLGEAIHRGEVTLPSEEEERAMYDMALQRLHQAGFMQYEISNFAGRATPARITWDIGGRTFTWGWAWARRACCLEGSPGRRTEGGQTSGTWLPT